jgi:hypothetical protein
VEVPPTEPLSTSTGYYDVRRGAAGYAAIMGSVAGFAVPTVILAFTVGNKQVAHHQVELTLATGLLVLSLLGCLASAFAFSALAGERELTVNLTPAAMYMGVCVILSITAILGAFETFAHIYLPTSTDLFAAMTAGAGITGAVYNAMSVVDVAEIKQASLAASSQWFTTRRVAQRWVVLLALIGSAPAAAGAIIFWSRGGIQPSTRLVSWFAGIGLFIAVSMAVLGMFRSLHPARGQDVSARPREAVFVQLVTGAFVGVLMALLPA